jgi:hypothetical protein
MDGKTCNPPLNGQKLITCVIGGICKQKEEGEVMPAEQERMAYSLRTFAM